MIDFNTLPQAVSDLSRQIAELSAKVDSLLQFRDEQFFGDKALANHLGCSIQTIIRLKQAGKLPYHKIGRKYYYLKSEVDATFSRVPGKHL